MSLDYDPVVLEIMSNEFGALADEMSFVMRRSGSSFGAREGGDCMVGILDEQGRLIDRGKVGLSTWYLSMVIPFVLQKFSGKFKPGDIVATNDPYAGGSHLNDIVLIAPIFRRPAHAFGGCRMHHQDVGGREAGATARSPQRCKRDCASRRYSATAERRSSLLKRWRRTVAPAKRCRRHQRDMRRVPAGRDRCRLIKSWREGLTGRHLIDYAPPAALRDRAHYPTAVVRRSPSTTPGPAGPDDHRPAAKIDGETMTVDHRDGRNCKLRSTFAREPSDAGRPKFIRLVRLGAGQHECGISSCPRDLLVPSPQRWAGARSPASPSSLLLATLAAAARTHPAATPASRDLVYTAPETANRQHYIRLYLNGSGGQANGTASAAAQISGRRPVETP